MPVLNFNIKHKPMKEKKESNLTNKTVCPKCGSSEYEEWEELEYEKGGDDPMYGGDLLLMKFSKCSDCE